MLPNLPKEPQVVSAAIKLPDGGIIDGASHEDALNKIGKSKEEESYSVGRSEIKGDITKMSPEEFNKQYWESRGFRNVGKNWVGESWGVKEKFTNEN